MMRPSSRLAGVPLLLRLPAILMLLFFSALQEMLRPRSFLRPFLINVLGKEMRRRRRQKSQGGTRTEVKADYRVVDEKPT